MRRLLVAITSVAAIVALLTLAGCNERVNGIVSPGDYAQVNKEMTMDEVEDLLGPPQRSHKSGSPSAPTIYWNYGKTEGEGLVRIAFVNGKVISTTPYNQNLNPDE